ncbi:twin-arginine translocase subunit TatC [bacterium]|jgi:sec-independent protein translocase protein TatC|nr:twin-arginine translocase subunit TatC [bacterium]
MANPVTLISHIRELRYRACVSAVYVLIGFIVALYFFNDIIDALAVPFQSFPSFNKFYITSIFEGFFTKLKLSFIIGAILAFPVIVYQLLRFIFPGLLGKEKKLIIISVFVSVLLSALAFYFGYFVFMPYSIQFLMSKTYLPDNVSVILNYNKNIFYIINFLFYSLIVFQFPIILECLLYLNLVKRKSLIKASRYVIVGIFVVSAFVTPPDIISQVGISIPLICLYFLTILVAKIFGFGEDNV